MINVKEELLLTSKTIPENSTAIHKEKK